MPGRHASHAQVRPSRWPRRLLILFLIAAVVAGGYFGRDYLPGSVRDSVSAVADRVLGGDEECSTSVPVEIAASPDLAPALTEVFEAGITTQPEGGASCVEPNVTPRPSSEVAESVGPQSFVDLWIPDSSMWLSRVEADEIEFSAPTSVASSPLVGVASQPVAQALGEQGASFSWSAMLSGDGPPATIVDPTTSSTGYATLLAGATALGVGTEEANLTAVVAAMTALRENVTPTTTDAFAAVEASPESAPLFTATEQAVAGHNRTGGSPVVALYPAEGTAIFDYPAIAVGRADTPEAVRSAARDIVAMLQTPEAVQIMQDHGFRSPEGAAGASMGVGDGIDTAPVEALPQLPEEAARQIASQWTSLSLDMRMLAVIDVSGSMAETDESEATRADLVQGAATGGLGLLPESSSVGLWVFSTHENEETGADWEELVPVGPLTEDVGGVSRLEALAGQSATIPGIVEENVSSATRGWTGLYDTIDGAFSAMNNGYDPNRVNSIVLFTDGEDENPPGETSDISLDALLTKIEAHDPTRPIPVIAIGVGPSADMDALNQLAEASGGFADQALDPADVEDVFLQAMIERQCRPMCG